MLLARLTCGGLITLLLVQNLFAADIGTDLAVEGKDSGWTVTWPEESVSGVAVHLEPVEVDLVNRLVALSIEISFNGLYDAVEDAFPQAKITFHAKPTMAPLPTIVIIGQTIHNNTGVPWHRFKWSMPGNSRARFFSTVEDDWQVYPPFASLKLTSDRLLMASGGWVQDGKAFTPSGSLTIEMLGSVGPSTEIVLKHSAVPEPSAALLLACGLGLRLLSRRRAARRR